MPPADSGPFPPDSGESPPLFQGRALGPLVRRSLFLLLVLAAVLGLVPLAGFAANLPWASAAGLQAPAFFIAAFLVWGLSPPLQAVRFRYLLALRSSRPAFPLLVQLHFAERFFAPILPFRLGLPVKALLLQRGGGVEMGTGLSITVLDALFESAVAIAIAILGAPLLVRTSLYLFGAVAAGLAAAFFLVTPERLKAWSGGLREGTFRGRAMGFLHDLRLQTGALLRDVRLLGILPLLALSQGLILATGHLTLLSVGHAIPPASLLFILNASALLGNATGIPSGWGVRELTLTALLTVAGVPSGSALLFSVLFRSLTFPLMAFGYVFAVRLGWKGIVQ